MEKQEPGQPVLAPVTIFVSKVPVNVMELQQFYTSRGMDAEALRIIDHIPIVEKMKAEAMVQTKMDHLFAPKQ